MDKSIFNKPDGERQPCLLSTRTSGGPGLVAARPPSFVIRHGRHWRASCGPHGATRRAQGTVSFSRDPGSGTSGDGTVRRGSLARPKTLTCSPSGGQPAVLEFWAARPSASVPDGASLAAGLGARSPRGSRAACGGRRRRRPKEDSRHLPTDRHRSRHAHMLSPPARHRRPCQVRSPGSG